MKVGVSMMSGVFYLAIGLGVMIVLVIVAVVVISSNK